MLAGELNVRLEIIKRGKSPWTSQHEHLTGQGEPVMEGKIQLSAASASAK